jgi:hypothetical protein
MYRRPPLSRSLILEVACWLLVVTPGLGLAADDAGSTPVAAECYQSLQPLLQTYCTDCHGGETPEAKVRLDFRPEELNLGEQHNLWRVVLEKIRLREMPPDSEPQPTEAERAQGIAKLEELLRQVDCGTISRPGRVTFRRLNRSEYNLTLRDLLGIDFRPAEDFPVDDTGKGFDNIAEVLSMPPLLMEKYLDAAENVVRQVLDTPALRDRLLAVATGPGLSDQPEEQRVRLILEPHARRAFRRPLRDGELERLMMLYREEAAAGVSFPQSLALPLVASLASPHFLFRIELDGPSEPSQTARPLNGHELATRMSYFLWSSMPDDELFGLAESGQLATPATQADQVRRMLADPKAQALVENFFGQWLELRNLNKIVPDPERFPSFNDDLRESMKRETLAFVAHIVAGNRSVLEFLDADYAFLNEPLARHYGIAGVEGAEFRQVALPDARRGGLLTQASVLTLTSNPTRTSPVKRGKWILENILGAPPPPPPPNVQLLAEEGETELLGSLRERMEQHRADPSCAVCHTKMDALGFGFENFDAIGAWRDQDGQFAINASGSLPGNQQFSGPAELRRLILADRRDQFVRCLTEKMLIYALGRELSAADECEVRRIGERMAADGYHLHTLVREIVGSLPFQQRETIQPEN